MPASLGHLNISTSIGSFGAFGSVSACASTDAASWLILLLLLEGIGIGIGIQSDQLLLKPFSELLEFVVQSG